MNLSLIKNLIWLFVAIIVAIAIQAPMIWHGSYQFIFPNTLIVALTILYFRNTFDFRSLALHYNKWFKYGLFVFNIFLFIYLLNRVELVMGHIDSMYMEKIIKTKTFMDIGESKILFDYIHTEYLIFTVATFIAIAIYNTRILSSFWSRANVKRERQLN